MGLFGDRYVVGPLSKEEAQRIVVESHYLHRKAPCEQCWALLDTTESRNDVLFDWGKVVGVIMYGTPSSAPLRKGICGSEHKNNVIELTRLWIHDEVPKNGASYLIGNTISDVKKEIVVSYADRSQGHIGYVYQATNWYYTGLSAKRTNWHIDGLDTKHSQTLADKYSAEELRDKYGDRFTLVDRPRKHRYVYFSTDRRTSRELKDKLNYDIKPYPKPL